MLRIKIKPIDKWIGKETKYPGWSQFSSTYSQTKKLLASELDKAGAIESSIQLEMFIRKEDLRLDGELRANAKPYKQGVILSFSVKNKKGVVQTRSFPSDTPNFISFRQQGQRNSPQWKTEGFDTHISRAWQRHWFEIAFTFCRDNDGLPDGLDVARLRNDIKRRYPTATEKDIERAIKRLKSQYRKKRIELMGNAIVPQITKIFFEIYKNANYRN